MPLDAPQDDQTAVESAALSHFRKLLIAVEPRPLLAELNAHPELWDQHSTRRTFSGSPHADMRDIWVRMRPIEELSSPERYKEPYFSAFYPAWHLLPALHDAVHGLCALARSVHLGPVLITRLPPGGEIKPHSDTAWSARYFNLKAHWTLANDGGCASECCGERIVMSPGEIWTFDNTTPHSVQNSGAADRIVVIVSMRVEP